GRAIGVIGMPGDRRNEDHLEFGKIAAGAFDAIVVREDKNLRGRNPGESAALVVDGINRAHGHGARCATAQIVPDEQDATAAAMALAQPGDLVMLCADDSAAVYSRVVAEAHSRPGGSAIAAPGEFAVEEG
ncbi:MAG: cyanophycin synthetase, partial [Candidatus Limnocylindrales bacterium]